MRRFAALGGDKFCHSPGCLSIPLAYCIPALVQMARHLKAAVSGLFPYNLDAYQRFVRTPGGQDEIMEREIICACWKSLGIESTKGTHLPGLDQT